MTTEGREKKGGITTTMALGFALSLALSMGGAIYASAINTDARIESKTEELRSTNLDLVQRTARLEEAVSTIKGSNEKVEKKIDDFIKELRSR